MRLMRAEVEAFPWLFRLRTGVSLPHRAGRWLEGKSEVDEVTSRLEHALRLDRWWQCNEQRLIELVAGRQH